MGGGTILILLLSLFLNLNQHVAQATNLVFFIPTALTATIVNFKNKNINWKNAIPVTIIGVIGSIIGATISSDMNVQVLRKLFGIFLIAIAIYEIYSWYKMYIKEKLRHNKDI